MTRQMKESLCVRYLGFVALRYMMVLLSATSSQAAELAPSDCTGPWCPELDTCIQWAQICPIDGDTFVGPTKLLCVEGRCSSDEECSWTDGGATYASYYFTDLNEEFDVPSGCTLNCTGCVLAPEDGLPSAIGMPNPASVTCDDSGGSSETKYDTDGGQYGVCAFDDGTACEEWALKRGECEKGSKPVFSAYCTDNGGQLTNKSVDWGDIEGAPAADYEVCNFENGTECVESDYYGGKCTTPVVSDSSSSITVSSATASTIAASATTASTTTASTTGASIATTPTTTAEVMDEDPETFQDSSGGKGLCSKTFLVLSVRIFGLVACLISFRGHGMGHHHEILQSI